MQFNKRSGISLLILVITIVVMLILSSAVIITIVNNNVITQALKLAFKTDLDTFKTELELYKSEQYMDRAGRFNASLLQADEVSVTYDKIKDTNKTIKDVIPSLAQASKYTGQFQVVNGKLVFEGSDPNQQDWTEESGVDIDDIAPENPVITLNPAVWTNGSVTVTISYPSDAIVKEYSIDGTTWNNYTTDIIVSENNTIVSAKCSDTAGNVSEQVTLTVSNIDNIAPTVTATNGGSTTSSVTVNALASDAGGSEIGSYQYSKDNGANWTTSTTQTSYTFSSISTGIYQCKARVADNAGNSSTSTSVTITTQGLGTITLGATPTGWTNGNVTVTINYPAEAVIKQYSTNGTTWNNYTAAITITSNGTILAKGADAGSNQIAQASLTISNIDKTVPTVTATDGGKTTSSVTVNAAASDTGGSGLVAGSYQYSKDNGTTWTTATTATNYTFSSITTGTYQCKVKVADNAGNSTTSTAVAITTQALGTITLVPSTTGWTNGDVTVTINYPVEVVTIQYSVNGGSTWLTYSGMAVTITDNNTTILAKGLDAGGNQTVQASLTISNIDKVAPIVTATDGGKTTSSITVNATASDTGGSGLTAGSYQYSKDNGATWTTATAATNYTFSGITTGTYQCKVKVADNVGNITVSAAVAITTQGLGTITLGASPAGWTTGNVTVTITYPAEATTKQYSTDGTTWNAYTAPIVVTTSGITVYAKGTDVAGNQIAQATLTVANIDRTAPIATFGTNGGFMETAYTTVTVSDVGGSNVNTGTLQYVWDTQNVTTPVSGWTAFTNGSAITKTNVYGTYYLWIRANDNVGNSVVTKSNSFLISSIESYEDGINPVFSYYNVTNWCPTADVSYNGGAAYWTGILDQYGNGTATTSFNITVPNDGNQYSLGYYIYYNDSNGYYNTVRATVNGTYYYPSYTMNDWVYNEVPLNPGSNVITFFSGFDSPDISETGFVALDDLQVIRQ